MRVEETISVIVPVRHGGPALSQCLAHVFRSSKPLLEVIVVADGDPHETSRIASELGARAAHGAFLFFVDADVAVKPDAVEQILASFASEPGLAAVFGSYDDEPEARNFLSQYRNLLHHHVHQTSREHASTFWAGCGAIRRDVFLAAGGFDERYRHASIEDIELGYRLTQDGHRIRLCRSLQAKHLKRWRPWALLHTDFVHRALPWTKLILRDRRMPDDLNVTLQSRLSVTSAWAVLGSLALAWWTPPALALAMAFALLLVALNASLYRFFLRRRGVGFALLAIVWHWIYFLSSGVAFAIGVVLYGRVAPRVSRGAPSAGGVRGGR